MKISPQSRHLRQPPPRHISLITQLSILLGGFLNTFGWIFLTFGSLFVWVFGYNSEARFIFDPPIEKWEIAEGVILNAERTGSSVNGQNVWQYDFQLYVNERAYSGTSYTITQRFKEGAEVPVLYLFDAPEKSYIKGTKRAHFPAWTALVVSIFPLVGLIMILVTVKRNTKFLRLLQNGQFTRGQLKDKQSTNSSITINGRHYPIYKYEFEFLVGSHCYSAFCQTHLTQRVEDEEKEIVLYNAHDPKDAIVYDAFKNAPDINGQGQLEPMTLKQSWVILLPILFILVNYILWTIMIG